MKNSGRMTGMVLTLLIAGTFTLSAQRGMRGNNDFRGDARPQTNTGVRQGRPVAANDSAFVRGMGRGFAKGPMQGNLRGGMRGPGFGQGRGAGFHNGIGHVPLIPNLTEKQIADIKALGVNHKEEMTKFREENAKKVQTMRDENHKKFLEILTDEQKKVLEAAAPAKPATLAPSAPAVKK